MENCRKRDFTICDIVGVCAMTRHEFVQELFSLPTQPISATICLVGIPAVNSAKESPLLADVYNHCTIATIDGMPLVKLARRKGFVCERCSGPDIMGMVFAESVRQGKTHYFYGGKDETVIQKLRQNLKRDYPGIQIVGSYVPPFRPLTEEEDKAVCAEINALHPDFVWVGIGAPKQELWMWAHRETLHHTTMLGVGAAFNFLAGTLDKAPHWIEEAGIEWLYRLIKEPKRLWRRYILGGLKYNWYTLQSKFKKR